MGIFSLNVEFILFSVVIPFLKYLLLQDVLSESLIFWIWTSLEEVMQKQGVVYIRT